MTTEQSVLEVDGAAGAFADAVTSRGLVVASGFPSNVVDGGKRRLELTNAGDHNRYVQVVGGRRRSTPLHWKSMLIDRRSLSAAQRTGMIFRDRMHLGRASSAV